MPEAEFVVEPVGHDRRDYRVSFTKINMMIGFRPNWTVEDGVRQVVNAIRAGEISDYREAHYSNERYLHEINGNGLDRPQVQWAHDLIRQSCPPTNTKAVVGVVPVVAVRPRLAGRI